MNDLEKLSNKLDKLFEYLGLECQICKNCYGTGKNYEYYCGECEGSGIKIIKVDRPK